MLIEENKRSDRWILWCSNDLGQTNKEQGDHLLGPNVIFKPNNPSLPVHDGHHLVHIPLRRHTIRQEPLPKSRLYWMNSFTRNPALRSWCTTTQHHPKLWPPPSPFLLPFVFPPIFTCTLIIRLRDHVNYISHINLKLLYLLKFSLFHIRCLDTNLHSL